MSAVFTTLQDQVQITYAVKSFPTKINLKKSKQNNGRTSQTQFVNCRIKFFMFQLLLHSIKIQHYILALLQQILFITHFVFMCRWDKVTMVGGNYFLNANKYKIKFLIKKKLRKYYKKNFEIYLSGTCMST